MYRTVRTPRYATVPFLLASAHVVLASEQIASKVFAIDE